MFKRSSKTRTVVKTVTSYRGMTLDLWRASADRVHYIRELLADPMFNDVISALHNSIPFDHQEPSGSDNSLVKYGEVRGYMRCLANLSLMAIPVPEPAPELEPTYGVEEQEE